MRVAPAGKTFIALWTVATAMGIGLGWTFAAQTHNPLLIGIVLGVAQALILLPMWWAALFWAIVTSVGWAVGVAFLGALYGPSVGWYAYLGCLPFVAIPALTLMQWLVVGQWFKSEGFILWFAASVCSFPVAGFLAVVISLVANPGGRSFLVDLPPPIAPVFWLLGGFFGFFTGLALSTGAPDLYQQWRRRDGVAGTALALSIAGVAVILVHSALNALAGYDLIHDQADLGFYLLRFVVYLALGFSLARFLGARVALIVSFVVATADVLVDVAARLAMSEFGGVNRLIHDTSPDFLLNIMLPVLVWNLFAALGVALSRTRFLRPVSRSQVYRVKL